jgi:hypothetical protein
VSCNREWHSSQRRSIWPFLECGLGPFPLSLPSAHRAQEKGQGILFVGLFVHFPSSVFHTERTPPSQLYIHIYSSIELTLLARLLFLCQCLDAATHILSRPKPEGEFPVLYGAQQKGKESSVRVPSCNFETSDCLIGGLSNTDSLTNISLAFNNDTADTQGHRGLDETAIIAITMVPTPASTSFRRSRSDQEAALAITGGAGTCGGEGTRGKFTVLIRNSLLR